jgi:hypothetical protein
MTHILAITGKLNTGLFECNEMQVSFVDSLVNVVWKYKNAVNRPF